MWSNYRPAGRMWPTRASGSSPAGGQWCPAPHLKYVPPISCFALRLLHTSNIAFKNVPPFVFCPSCWKILATGLHSIFSGPQKYWKKSSNLKFVEKRERWHLSHWIACAGWSAYAQKQRITPSVHLCFINYLFYNQIRRYGPPLMPRWVPVWVTSVFRFITLS